MAVDGSETLVLLDSWHRGNREALDQLLERDLPFVRDYVAARMGDLLRAKVEVDDLVHEAMIAALRYTPRFLVAERDQFRALLARITENVLRDSADKYQAQRRDARREQETPSDSMLYLDPSLSTPTRPSQAATRNEERMWIRLAIDLLPPEDRRLILWHDYDELSFHAIAEQLDISKDAARMRFNRALPQLARLVKQLKAGELGPALRATEGDRA